MRSGLIHYLGVDVQRLLRGSYVKNAAMIVQYICINLKTCTGAFLIGDLFVHLRLSNPLGTKRVQIDHLSLPLR